MMVSLILVEFPSLDYLLETDELTGNVVPRKVVAKERTEQGQQDRSGDEGSAVLASGRGDE
jgi:hypothetical protein